MCQKLKGIICGAAVIFLFYAVPVEAGINEWTATGPNSDPVKNLSVDPVDPSILYILTEKTGTQGAYKGTNSGSTWSPINMSGMYVEGFAVDPANHATLYAGTSDMVLKSPDGGTSWSSIYTAPVNYFFNVFAVDQVNNFIIYAGTTFAGVMKSINGGASWNVANTGMTGLSPGIIAIDPANHETIYTGTLGGLFKSLNGGASWSKINSSLVKAFAVDPQQTNTLYLATSDGILKSIDGGDNWFNSGAGMPDPSFNGTSAVAIDPWNSANLYAGTSAGVYRSSNGGETWNAMNTGLANTTVNKLSIDPKSPVNLYAGTEGGLFKITFQSTGTLYLTYTKEGSGYGTVSSSPPGIHCDDDCSALFNDGDLVTLHATPATGSLFMGWSGQCSGTADCTVFMDLDKGVSAKFDLQTEHMVKVLGNIPWIYYNLHDAYDSADSGNVILAMATDYIEDLACGGSKNLSLKGGYDSGFATVSGYTTLRGNLTIASGELTLENLVIR